MADIYVDFLGLEQLGENCKDISSKIAVIQSDFENIVRQLDWDVRFQSEINGTATRIARQLEQYSKILESYWEFIQYAHNSYTKINNKEIEFSELNKIAGSMISDVVFAEAVQSSKESKPSQTYPDTASSPEESKSSYNDELESVNRTKIEKNPGHYRASTSINGTKFKYKNTDVSAELGKSEFYVDNKFHTKGNGTDDLIDSQIKIGSTISALSANAKQKTGNKVFGSETNIHGSLGTLDVKGDAKFYIGKNGIDTYVEGNAMASAAQAKASYKIKYGLLEASANFSGYAGVGAKGTFGIKNNKFVIEGGASAGVGAGVGLEVGLNEDVVKDSIKHIESAKNLYNNYKENFKKYWTVQKTV